MDKPEIVFENNDFWVINKPVGWLSTNEGKKAGAKSVEDWASQRVKKVARSGVVHRLDKDTSGLLLVAKTQKVMDKLQQLFKKRRVVKKYWAVVEGQIVSQGQINLPIGRSRYRFDRFGIRVDGKRAVTGFRRRAVYRGLNGRFNSLIVVRPKTGRTHQIRVHLAYLGWPLLGDKLYGSKNKEVGKFYLQCFYLKFDLEGQEYKFRIGKNKYFRDLLKAYEKV